MIIYLFIFIYLIRWVLARGCNATNKLCLAKKNRKLQVHISEFENLSTLMGWVE
ncbi:hypothetical protein I3843_08G069900 [Carya illinoinensis]|nr:hypothetical protein I3843_08G069900 [Carya illinoinensis]